MEIDTSVQPHEAAMLSLDCTKARTRLGWLPGLELEMALQWTVEWYKRYQRGDDIRGLTEDQISRFQEIAIVH
jgi:CDP-glucose 4,6-dehydratase